MTAAKTRHEYSRQALTYDVTRGVSSSVLVPLLKVLEGTPDPRRLLDAGGGTGNYALALQEHGFAPTVLDINEAMLARATEKGLATVHGDVAELAFADASFDAVVLVSMIHHIPDWRLALSEARRVLVDGGRLVVMGWTREHVVGVMWLDHYFPSTRAWLEEIHEPLSAFAEVLPGMRTLPVRFEDVDDMSVGALQRQPELLLDEGLRRQTSFFERLASVAPDELLAGTARLRADLAAGHDPRAAVEACRDRIGDACVMVWEKAGASARR